MKEKYHSALCILLLTGFCMVVSACSPPPEVTIEPARQVISSGEECHLCGMVITEFPGPKGMAAARTDQYIRKFCSTMDLFSYYLDPENTHQVTHILVHDMTASDWQSPDDHHFIDARTAWFVIGSERMGAMGHTLASFSSQSAAEDFANKYQGQVKAFSQISLSDLTASH